MIYDKLYMTSTEGVRKSKSSFGISPVSSEESKDFSSRFANTRAEDKDIENEEIDEIDEAEEFKDDWGTEDEETE